MNALDIGNATDTNTDLFDSYDEALPEIPFVHYRATITTEAHLDLINLVPNDHMARLRDKIYLTAETEEEYLGRLAAQAGRFDLIEMEERP